MRGVWDTITSAMTSWHQGKLFVEHTIAINHDALHVIVGVLLWIALGFILRQSLSSWFPWAWLLAFILWNETVDLWVEQWPDPGQQYGEGAKDVLLTMFLPTVLMLVVRLRPQLFAGAPKRRRR
jgi:hypothetical protein